MKLNKLVCALMIGVGHGAWAAGNINMVNGEAVIISRDGQPRAAKKGDRVVEGDTLTTGAAAEMIVLTDDSGVLAIRPLSRVVIEKYNITGTDKDAVTLNLLRGALRSITGWISQTAPRNYRVQTAMPPSAYAVPTTKRWWLKREILAHMTVFTAAKHRLKPRKAACFCSPAKPGRLKRVTPCRSFCRKRQQHFSRRARPMQR